MRRWCSLLVAILLVGAPGSASAATAVREDAVPSVAALQATTVSWTSSQPGPSLIWDATAFAASTGQLVQFGGTTGYEAPTSTRLFDPKTGAWTTVAAPSRSRMAARAHSAMAWDPVHKKVVLFGGRMSAVMGDTWLFDPASRTWTQAATRCKAGTTCPLPRSGHKMVWSSVLGRIVLFGGEPGGTAGVVYNDVWTFDGAAWTKLATIDPPAGRAHFGMAEDPSTGRIVVFGGVDEEFLHPDLATWVLNPSTRAWTRVATSTVPEPKALLGMAWLGSVGAVVVATGDPNEQDNGYSNSVWAFDAAAGNWRQLTTTGGAPTPRMAATLTANPADGSAILIGGAGDDQLPPTLADRTWILR